MKSGHSGPPHASLHPVDFIPLEKNKLRSLSECIPLEKNKLHSLSECQFHLSIVSGSVCQLHRFQTYVSTLHSLVTSLEQKREQG